MEITTADVVIGYYDEICDICLFDRHYCATCEDVVGHGHVHVEA